MDEPVPDRSLDRLWLPIVALGVALRALRFGQDWPLWWNEAFVAVNLFDRDYAGLLRPLAYRQVCPVGFLWAEKALVDLLGPSTWSLRLLPFLASVAALFVLCRIARRLSSPAAGLAALGLLAVAYHPIRLGSELKPYSVDLLAAAIVLDRALAHRANRSRMAPLVHLAVLTPILMLVSYPAALALAGTAGALVVSRRSNGAVVSRSCRVAIVAWLAVLAVSALLVRGLAAGQAAAARGDVLNEYLRDGFPGSWTPADLFRWLTEVALGRLFAFPFGDAGFASVLGLALAALGVIRLARRDLGLLALVLGPFAASAGAACLGVYPLGGHPRVAQHLMPSVALLYGFGIEAVVSRLALPARLDRRGARMAFLGLLILGGLPLLRDFAQPYRTAREVSARRFARAFWPAIGADGRVVDLRGDLGLLPPDSSNPDVALHLANQRLYESSTGTVDSGRLRCVLYYAPGLERPELDGWLARLSDAHQLVARETHDLPDHGARGGRVEVFEFTMRRAPGPATVGALESGFRR